MAQLVIPNAAILTLRWSGLTRTWRNVIGVQGISTLPVIDQALANTLHTEIMAAANIPALMALMSDNTIFEGIVIRDISGPNRAEYVSTGTPLAGGDATDPLPLNVAACVTVRTAFAGRSFRGRVYFSGWAESQNDANGRAVAGVGTAATNALISINSVLAGHGMTVAVLSRPRDAKVIPAVTITAKGGTSAPVTGFASRNTKWESQRRRTGRD